MEQRMAPQVSVVKEDVASVAADVLLLKYAQHFYGADEAVALRLFQHGVCKEVGLAPADGDFKLLEARGSIAAERALFLGTSRLGSFRYREMRHFARRAIEILARQPFSVRVLATTVHGAGYGLDIEEALRSLVLGFQQGLTTHPLASLEQIVFVERNARRFEVLSNALGDVELVLPATIVNASGAVVGTFTPARSEPERKKSVFVAMPFAEEFEDIYQFGIYAAVRRLGYVCEKVDESAFTGNIVERIIEGIKNAEFVIADLSLERTNVYLEVGFAWGLNRPVILVAREGQRLHFDLSHHKCLFYRTIGKLSESLEKTIRDMPGQQPPREASE
jgi:hypothetical protein